MEKGLPYFRRQNYAHKGNFVKSSSLVPVHFKMTKKIADTIEKILRSFLGTEIDTKPSHLMWWNRVAVTLWRVGWGHWKSGAKETWLY